MVNLLMDQVIMDIKETTAAMRGEVLSGSSDTLAEYKFKAGYLMGMEAAAQLFIERAQKILEDV